MPKMTKCGYCAERTHIDAADTNRTWQQWQCGCCGSWNDKPEPRGRSRGEAEQFAAKALEYLMLARTAAKNAGSKRTIVRIDAAISSARGGVRAASYRDRRAV